LETNSASGNRDSSQSENWDVGGGAYYCSLAAMENGLLPVIFSTVGMDNDGRRIIETLRKKKENNLGIITCLIEESGSFSTSRCDIVFWRGGKDTKHQFAKHPNDFTLRQLSEAVEISGVGSGDVVFVFGFRLNRKMLQLNPKKLKDELKELKEKRLKENIEEIEKKEEELKKMESDRLEYIKDFMECLSPKTDISSKPTVIFDLTPSNLYENMTLRELAEVVEKSDILVAEIKTLLGFLFLDQSPDTDLREETEITAVDVDPDIKQDFKTVMNGHLESIKGKNYIPEIAKHFLGKGEGKYLIIRYGEGHTECQTALKRTDTEIGYILEDSRDTEYTKKKGKDKLGYGDKLTFKFLKDLKDKEDFRSNYKETEPKPNKKADEKP
jgi:hypothetical protein